MNKVISIVAVVARLFLGGMMVLGGADKFAANPAPTEVVAKAEKFTAPEKEETLQKVLYINGMKQTGYAWQVLGIFEILFGILVIIQFTSFVGSVFLLPITAHIFLFHVFLEADETGELVMTGLLMAANLFLIFKDYAKWKHLLSVHPFKSGPSTS